MSTSFAAPESSADGQFVLHFHGDRDSLVADNSDSSDQIIGAIKLVAVR